MFITYIYKSVISALGDRPTASSLPPSPSNHTPPSLTPPSTCDYISESQAEPRDTQTSITLHLAMELGPFLRTSKKFNPQNTELSVIPA